MFVVQYNCGRGYKSTIASLETAISVGADIICFQELFLGNKNITHSTFNFYYLERSKTDARILMALKKELVNKIIIENWTDLLNYPYFLALDILDVEDQSWKPTRRTRVVNIYGNCVGQRYT